MSDEAKPATTTRLDEAVTALTDATDYVLEGGDIRDVSDEAIAQTLYAAARLFAAKKDRVGHLDWPITPDALTATETVVLVTALLDAADVNIFDMAIWYRRVE